MPQASAKSVIHAPYEAVQALLVDKMERPKQYVGIIQKSEILERGEGYIIREMAEPGPSGMVIREKIYRRPAKDGEEFVYEHINNKSYTGFFHNILTPVEGHPDQCQLEYIMDWTPHPGTEDPIAQPQADRMVRMGVDHIKELAENPPEIPPFVRAFYDAVDSLDPSAMAPLLTDNVRFRMGSFSDLVGKDTVLRLNGEVMSHWRSIKHHYVSIHHVGGKTFAEVWVDYVLRDGKGYTLPFLTVFEREEELISNIKVFGDPSPLVHGWPGEH